MNYAWPTAQIAVMGAKGAVEIIFRQDIGDAGQDRGAHQGIRGPLHAAVRGRRARLHRRGDHAAFDAPARSPARSRCCGTRRPSGPWKKHDNIPL